MEKKEFCLFCMGTGRGRDILLRVETCRHCSGTKVKTDPYASHQARSQPNEDGAVQEGIRETSDQAELVKKNDD